MSDKDETNEQTANNNQGTEKQAPPAARPPQPLPGVKEMEKMTVPQLQELLRAAGLPVEGKKAELVKRLQAKRLGGERQVVPGGHTLCPHCGASAYITGSRILSVLKNGQRVKYYRFKCGGPRRHTFTIKQIEGAPHMVRPGPRPVRKEVRRVR